MAEKILAGRNYLHNFGKIVIKVISNLTYLPEQHFDHSLIFACYVLSLNICIYY